MAIDNIMQNNNDCIIDRPEPILITKKTVKFGADLYQFKNITGFGLAEVKNNNIFPTPLILGTFILGITMTFVYQILGILIIVAAIGGFLANISQPRRYGLKLYTNSGNNTIFVTTDIQGVKRVVSLLYEFMESETEGSYVINIDQRNASIGVGYAKNIRADNIGGSIDNQQR